MKTKKGIMPKSVYGDGSFNGKGEFDIEPFAFVACFCTSCNKVVPYRYYCCECGQKFIINSLMKELNII